MIQKKERSKKQIWGFLALLATLTPSLFSAQVTKYRKVMPEKGHLIQSVPYEKWLKRNYCGPASLAMVLNYWDERKAFSQETISDAVYDFDKQATYNSEMVYYPRSQGFVSYSFQGSLETLKEVVSEGIPVIVLTKTIKQLNKGHYRVVIGFDEKRNQIIFHDPFFGSHSAMKSKNFIKVWELGNDRNQFHWMLAVVPSQDLFPFPALQNNPLTAINMATAYYRKSDFHNAKQQWLIARDMIKEDPFPLCGLAMVSLREGKAEEAESYALQALDLDPESASANAALGLAYASQGKIDQAMHSLDCARRLDPDAEYIRLHYLQVIALYSERSRQENKKAKENQNE